MWQTRAWESWGYSPPVNSCNGDSNFSCAYRKHGWIHTYDVLDKVLNFISLDRSNHKLNLGYRHTLPRITAVQPMYARQAYY